MAKIIKPNFTDQYVVFVKSTPELWAKMPEASKLDNTLYFVTAGDKDTGSLYLGQKLIADGAGVTSYGIDALKDVSISNAINNGDILQYNRDNNTWENVSLASTIGDLVKVFKGATLAENGTSGLVPQPTTVDLDKYLRGDGTWANPAGAIGEDVSTLKAQVATIIGEDADKSMRAIAKEEVATIIANAPQAFDTLKEIADWITTTESNILDVTSLSTRVTAVESDVKILKETTGNLTTLLADTANKVTDHGKRIDALEKNLKWQSLEEVDET